MTPPAATVAGRSAGKKRSSGAGGSGKPPRGHRRGLRQQPAPKAPRRVSGPVGGVIAVPPREQTQAPARTPDPVRAPAPAARPTRAPRPQQEQPRTRPARRSPSERPRRQQPAPRPRRVRQRTAATPLGARALHALRTVPDHRLLDRLIRGRAWIPLLGLMLAGIVAMQVEVLKLGASIGRSLERTSTLQTRNETLREAVASLDNDARIESLAIKQGMVMPAPGNTGFLSAGDAAAAVGRAVANIHAPDAPGFLALVSTNGTIPSSSNSSPTGTAGVATASATLANTLAQTASQTSSASQPTTTQSTTTPTTSGTTGSATASGTTTPTGAASPTSGQTQPSAPTSSGSPGTATPVSTPTQSTSSGASGSGGASLGG